MLALGNLGRSFFDAYTPRFMRGAHFIGSSGQAGGRRGWGARRRTCRPEGCIE
jgi:hypothetical protein